MNKRIKKKRWKQAAERSREFIFSGNFDEDERQEMIFKHFLLFGEVIDGDELICPSKIPAVVAQRLIDAAKRCMQKDYG